MSDTPAASLIDPSMDEQVAFLKSILEGSTEHSIIAKDLDGTILAWNEGTRRIYGYEPEDIIGRSAFLLHHPEDVAQGKPREILDEAARTGKWSGELRRVRKNGSIFTALVSITLRRDPKGAPLGFTMISFAPSPRIPGLVQRLGFQGCGRERPGYLRGRARRHRAARTRRATARAAELQPQPDRGVDTTAW